MEKVETASERKVLASGPVPGVEDATVLAVAEKKVTSLEMESGTPEKSCRSCSVTVWEEYALFPAAPLDVIPEDTALCSL